MRKSVSFLEISALVAVVAFALVAMRMYIMRAFSGRYRKLADEIGTQYDPYAANINSAITTHTITDEYMMYDSNNDYVGSAVISSTDQDFDSTEIIARP